MIALSSACLINNYDKISKLARDSTEPIYITKNGEDDLVVMSIKAFKEREKIFTLRLKLLEAELSRLNEDATYSVDEVRSHLKEKYNRM